MAWGKGQKWNPMWRHALSERQIALEGRKIGHDQASVSFAPTGLGILCARNPRAYALGYDLSPLRGFWDALN
jgi:hypothetical protein